MGRIEFLAERRAPQARGRGVAQALAHRVIELAQLLSIKKLWLQTESLNGGLYAHLGWTVVEQIKLKGTDVAIMEREISA